MAKEDDAQLFMTLWIESKYAPGERVRIPIAIGRMSKVIEETKPGGAQQGESILSYKGGQIQYKRYEPRRLFMGSNAIIHTKRGVSLSG